MHKLLHTCTNIILICFLVGLEETGSWLIKQNDPNYTILPFQDIITLRECF